MSWVLALRLVDLGRRAGGQAQRWAQNSSVVYRCHPTVDRLVHGEGPCVVLQGLTSCHMFPCSRPPCCHEDRSQVSLRTPSGRLARASCAAPATRHHLKAHWCDGHVKKEGLNLLRLLTQNHWGPLGQPYDAGQPEFDNCARAMAPEDTDSLDVRGVVGWPMACFLRTVLLQRLRLL